MTAQYETCCLYDGGKGGVGKTGVMVALAEWFKEESNSRHAARSRHRE